MRHIAGVAGAGAALTAAFAPPALADGAWHTSHDVDAITEAVRDGAIFVDGGDRFLVVCTHNKGARQRFWIAVQTDAKLGRTQVRPLTYRVGEDPPTTSKWDYTSRQVAPVWPFEDKHIVQRVLAGDAKQLIFRLNAYDGSKHDVTVPVDAEARRLMAATLDACGAGRP